MSRGGGVYLRKCSSKGRPGQQTRHDTLIIAESKQGSTHAM